MERFCEPRARALHCILPPSTVHTPRRNIRKAHSQNCFCGQKPLTYLHVGCWISSPPPDELQGSAKGWVLRLRELALRGQRESGRSIHATQGSIFSPPLYVISQMRIKLARKRTAAKVASLYSSNTELSRPLTHYIHLLCVTYMHLHPHFHTSLQFLLREIALASKSVVKLYPFQTNTTLRCIFHSKMLHETCRNGEVCFTKPLDCQSKLTSYTESCKKSFSQVA